MEPFEVELTVRDYECDLQGIVNNAVYQHYLEHARHTFLEAMGLNFHALRSQGLEPVVIRADIAYKASLRPGDRFKVTVQVKRLGRLRFIFEQDIYRLSDQKQMIEAKITGVFTKRAVLYPRIPLKKWLPQKGGISRILEIGNFISININRFNL